MVGIVVVSLVNVRSSDLPGNNRKAIRNHEHGFDQNKRDHSPRCHQAAVEATLHDGDDEDCFNNGPLKETGGQVNDESTFSELISSHGFGDLEDHDHKGNASEDHVRSRAGLPAVKRESCPRHDQEHSAQGKDVAELPGDGLDEAEAGLASCGFCGCGICG